MKLKRGHRRTRQISPVAASSMQAFMDHMTKDFLELGGMKAWIVKVEVKFSKAVPSPLLSYATILFIIRTKEGEAWLVGIFFICMASYLYTHAYRTNY